MAKSYDLKSYQSWNFDDYFCLKVPATLIASIVFLCRSFLMVIIYMLASVKGATGDMALLLPGGDHPSSFAITALPAILVLFALIRRSPRGGRFVRWVWRNAKVFLVTSALLEIGGSAWILYTADAGQTSFVIPLLLIVDVYILLYVLVSKRVRDTFTDFPPTLEAIESRAH